MQSYERNRIIKEDVLVVLRPVQPLYLRARDERGTFTITCNDAAVLVVASDGLIGVYVRLGSMGDTEN